MENILESIKKLLGIPADYTAFDPDITMHINTVFLTLAQLGVGPPNAFSLKDGREIWSDFIPEDQPNFEAIKTYIGLKVRLIFDPPTSSAHMESIKQVISELEWRLNFAAESK